MSRGGSPVGDRSKRRNIACSPDGESKTVHAERLAFEPAAASQERQRSCSPLNPVVSRSKKTTRLAQSRIRPGMWVEPDWRIGSNRDSTLAAVPVVPRKCTTHPESSSVPPSAAQPLGPRRGGDIRWRQLATRRRGPPNPADDAAESTLYRPGASRRDPPQSRARRAVATPHAWLAPVAPGPTQDGTGLARTAVDQPRGRPADRACWSGSLNPMLPG